MKTDTAATLLQPCSEPSFLVGGLGLRGRLALVAALALAGLAVQTFALGFAGAPILLVAVVFALPRGVSNAPPGRPSGAVWKEVTEEEFDRLFELEERSKAWARFGLDVNCGAGLLRLLGFVALAAGVVVAAFLLQGGWDWRSALFAPAPGFRAELLLVDAAILFLPVWLFGLRSAWSPAGLLAKARALRTVLDRHRDYPDPDARVRPMLAVGRTDGGGSLPDDARLFVTWPHAPEGFLGLQVQVSLNKVQGVAHPYLYAVVLARKGFGLRDEGYRFPRDVLELVTDEEEVDVLVLRQRTTRRSGYETEPRDRIRIFEEAMDVARDHIGLTVS